MSLYSQIRPIMDDFDFDKVQRTMTFLDWRWAFVNDGSRVPSVDDLKDEAFLQLNTCIENFEKGGRPPSGMSVSCGGFQATITCFSSCDNPELKLHFYVDESRRREQDNY